MSASSTLSGAPSGPTGDPLAPPPALSRGQRQLVLAAGFLGWMFAGVELSMFVLIGRSALVDLIGGGDEKLVGQWFTWYQGMIMLGAAAGGWLFGWLGDKLGRTRAMGGSILCYSIATLVCAWAGDPWSLMVLRFMVGMGIGGVWPNAVSLVAEAWPGASRPFLAGLLGTAANFGFVLLGAAAFFWPVTRDSWRWVPAIGSAPIVLGVAVLMFVPESTQWLAKRVQRKMQGAGGSAETPLRDIFRRPLLKRTILGILLGAIPVIGTSANGNWLVYWSAAHGGEAARGSSAVVSAGAKTAPADPRKPAVTQMQRSSGAIVGSLLGGILAAMLGRRVTYFLISLFSLGLSSYIFGMLNPQHPHFGVYTVLLGFVSVMYFGWLPLFLPELFPTNVRSTGTGVSFNSGRVVAAVVVLGASWLITQFNGDYARVGVWTGFIYAMGMVVICFAPTKSGKAVTT